MRENPGSLEMNPTWKPAFLAAFAVSFMVTGKHFFGWMKGDGSIDGNPAPLGRSAKKRLKIGPYGSIPRRGKQFLFEKKSPFREGFCVSFISEGYFFLGAKPFRTSTGGFMKLQRRLFMSYRVLKGGDVQVEGVTGEP